MLVVGVSSIRTHFSSICNFDDINYQTAYADIFSASLLGLANLIAAMHSFDKAAFLTLVRNVARFGRLLWTA